MKQAGADIIDSIPRSFRSLVQLRVAIDQAATKSTPPDRYAMRIPDYRTRQPASSSSSLV